MAASRNSGPPEPAPPDAPGRETLAETVAAALGAAGIGRHSRLCCALSGGVDSVVLLDLLRWLQPRFGYTLTAAHVHHGLSPNADAWQIFCETLCARADVPLHVFRVTVPPDDPEGLEAAARRERHHALAQIESDWLVFGHHQDDQAETLLFRLLRGAGLRGAGAMAARRGRLLRPLLEARRAAITAHAQTHGLSWIEDESNADCRHTRNHVRHNILPVIETAFPAAVPALARAAAHFREADGLLHDLAALDERACGGAALSRSALLALGDARIANLLRWQSRRLDAPAPSQARLREAVRQLRTAAAEHPLHLPLGALACCVYRDRVWLARPAAAPAPEPVPWRGEALLPWAGGLVRFAPVTGAGLDRERLIRANEVCLSARAPGLRLRLDARRPERSFKNLCQEAGIPAWLRDSLPVLRVDGEAAWIGGIGAAAAFACAPGAPGIEPCWQARDGCIQY